MVGDSFLYVQSFSALDTVGVNVHPPMFARVVVYSILTQMEIKSNKEANPSVFILKRARNEICRI